MRSVCWFRNDLRVLDNPAFYYCCQNSEEVIATFFVNRKQWLEHNDAEVKVNFWIRNLYSLQQKLNELMRGPNGGWVTAAYFAGAILDPAGWLIPFGKAKNIYSMAKIYNIF